MRQKTIPKEQVNIFMPADLELALHRFAEAEQEKRSAVVIRFVREGLTRAGYWPEDKKKGRRK